MENETLEAVKKQLVTMKQTLQTGFTSQEVAKTYFQENEQVLEGVIKTLETITAGASEVEAHKKTVGSLREEIKAQAANPKELTEKELFYRLGRGIAATRRGNNAVLAELGFSPNSGEDNWTNPKDVSWVMGKGWIAQRAAPGDPMGDMSTSDKFLIHPSYENELVAIAEKKSVMMPLVESSPMTSASDIIPIEEDVNINLEWLTAYGEEIRELEHPKIENVERKALTCAGYFRYNGEFGDDSFIDLGNFL